ncbi:hypothetical protein L798_12952 [Zootermopsis nevadensis]|uniref:Retrotransposon gag domain-containing protein n=1 Tax=Zootermopsis nevadensis TaxID=136037 RepID=A0A067R5E7_ZOONE|nr:hypothetical protein L798_12952 [Zootermopsis nevadensis]
MSSEIVELRREATNSASPGQIACQSHSNHEQARGGSPTPHLQQPASDPLAVRHALVETEHLLHASADGRCMQNESIHVSESPNSNLNLRADIQKLISVEIPLPTFVDATAQNALFHVKQLDEYFELKAIPPQFRLTIAVKSLTNESAKSWILATAGTFQNYEKFKSSFIRQFWSNESQSETRCRIYQEKFSRQSDKSMSDHFLKYAVLARHLQPPMEDQEIIFALKAHYPISVQRIWLAKQHKNVEEVVSFLRQMDEIEAKEQGYRTEREPPGNSNPQNYRNNRAQYRGNDRNQERQYQVRGMEFGRGNNYQNRPTRRQPYFGNRRDNIATGGQHREEESRNHRQGNQLNPYAPTFNQERKEEDSDLRIPRPSSNQHQGN